MKYLCTSVSPKAGRISHPKQPWELCLPSLEMSSPHALASGKVLSCDKDTNPDEPFKWGEFNQPLRRRSGKYQDSKYSPSSRGSCQHKCHGTCLPGWKCRQKNVVLRSLFGSQPETSRLTEKSLINMITIRAVSGSTPTKDASLEYDLYQWS